MTYQILVYLPDSTLVGVILVALLGLLIFKLVYKLIELIPGM